MCFGKKHETRESPVHLDEVQRDNCHTGWLGRLLGTTMWAPGSLRKEYWRRFGDHDENGCIGLGHPNGHSKKSDETLRIYGWEEEVVGLGADGGCDLTGGGFREAPNWSSRNDSRRISFSSWSCCNTTITLFRLSTESDMVTRKEWRWTNCNGRIY